MEHERAIRVRGAREHNLKNVDVTIPRDRMVVITGLSGSGKSSLAFDTIYAEGQRRYMESLSSYARQFLEQVQKPDIEYIEGLPPTISIQQRSGSANPRSTVATTTEIYDYLRVLFARAGTPYCSKCNISIERQSPQQIVDAVLRLPAGTKIMVLAPLVRGRKGEHQDAMQMIRREGFVRARIDGMIIEPENVQTLSKTRKHDIDVVIDRLEMKEGIRSRLHDSVETALRIGEGLALIARMDEDGEWIDEAFSENFACPDCGMSLPELTPRMFSFNSPYGACPSCDGLGTRMEVDENLVVPDKTAPLSKAILPWKKGGKRMNIYYSRVLRGLAKFYGVDLEAPYKDLPAEFQRLLMHGAGGESQEIRAGRKKIQFEGILADLMKRFQSTDSEYIKGLIHSFMSEKPCDVCKGTRLRPESRSVRIGGKHIAEVTSMTIEDGYGFCNTLVLSEERAQIAAPVLKEVVARLGFLNSVGLGYLTLDRRSGTLSGGEAQRIKLASQVGSGLVGVCYVLDEPTIGLHERDNHRLLKTLRHLCNMGNTVIVVEHDRETIQESDYIIDIGPLAGEHGGRVVYQGDIEGILSCEESLTGQYLSGARNIEPPKHRRPVSEEQAITVVGARENNLRNVNVSFPLGGLVFVTGVSGSGKSTLVNEILYKAAMRSLHDSRSLPGAHDTVTGLEQIDKVIDIDQSPIGRTPRSNPATYTGVFDEIRKLFARTKEAKLRGYKPGRFSFNVKGGRCEACQGQGTKCIEMHFLADVYVQCEVCKGQRFNRETLEIKYRGKSISEVLELTVEEGIAFFDAFPAIARILTTINDVGLGYMRLGQSCTTLSGGEAQRIKLASELCKRSTGRTMYILDEPTTGLHFEDIHKLMHVLNRLVDMGNTVVVIEHNLDTIKMADWIIDLGPDGGKGGGRVVAKGTPEDLAVAKHSYTGQFLKSLLNKSAIVWRVKTTRMIKRRAKAEGGGIEEPPAKIAKKAPRKRGK